MEENSIGVGLIVGIAITTTVIIYNSKSFNNIQKNILLVLIVFIPAQWILALIFIIYNTQKGNIKTNISKKSSEMNNLDHSKLINNYYYFIIIDDEQSSPLTFEELKNKKIVDTDLVWRKGLDKWLKASEIEELSDIIISTPPDHKIQKEINNIDSNLGNTIIQITDKEKNTPKSDEISENSFYETKVIYISAMGIFIVLILIIYLLETFEVI
jgi:hypothetical protein